MRSVDGPTDRELGEEYEFLRSGCVSDDVQRGVIALKRGDRDPLLQPVPAPMAPSSRCTYCHALGGGCPRCGNCGAALQ